MACLKSSEMALPKGSKTTIKVVTQGGASTPFVFCILSCCIIVRSYAKNSVES